MNKHFEEEKYENVKEEAEWLKEIRDNKLEDAKDYVEERLERE